MGELLTGTNTVRFANAVTHSSWAHPCRISKWKMNEVAITIFKNQPFWLLWHSFPHLRLKLSHFESNSIVIIESIPLFYVETANFCYVAFNTKKILTGHKFYQLSHASIFSKKWSRYFVGIILLSNDSYVYLQFDKTSSIIFIMYIYPTNRPTV